MSTLRARGVLAGEPRGAQQPWLPPRSLADFSLGPFLIGPQCCHNDLNSQHSPPDSQALVLGDSSSPLRRFCRSSGSSTPVEPVQFSRLIPLLVCWLDQMIPEVLSKLVFHDSYRVFHLILTLLKRLFKAYISASLMGFQSVLDAATAQGNPLGTIASSAQC